MGAEEGLPPNGKMEEGVEPGSELRVGCVEGRGVEESVAGKGVGVGAMGVEVLRVVGEGAPGVGVEVGVRLVDEGGEEEALSEGVWEPLEEALPPPPPPKKELDGVGLGVDSTHPPGDAVE